jgi:hypothetical protein
MNLLASSSKYSAISYTRSQHNIKIAIHFIIRGRSEDQASAVLHNCNKKSQQKKDTPTHKVISLLSNIVSLTS